MKYSEILWSIGKSLKADGYREIARGIFSKKLGRDSFGWISIVGSHIMVSTNAGIVFPEINKISYRILAQVFPNSREHQLDPRLGPPLVVFPVRVSTERDKNELDKSLSNFDNKEITASYLDKLYHSIVTDVYPFLDMNKNLADATEMAILHCKFGQAQKYLVPAALSYLGQFDRLTEYSKEYLSMSDFSKLSESYENYIRLLIPDLQIRE